MSVDQKPSVPPESSVIGQVTDDTDPVEGTEIQETQAMSDNQASSNVRQLLPTHLLPKTRTGRPVGRPRKLEPKPTATDLEYHAQMSEEKAKFIDQDPVVRSLSGRVDSANLLGTLRAEIAKEAAALHFTRIEAEKYGKDTAQTSTRRIDALTRIAHIELEIKKLAPDSIDVRGEKFQKIFAMFIEHLRETAAETLTPESIDLFFNRFSTKMDGWEEKASDLIR